jgi:hypothetical protein
MELAAERPWRRRRVQSLIVLGGISAGIWLAHWRSESMTMASTLNAPPLASPALTQLAESGRKLVVLRTVEQQARADLEQVRESLEKSTTTLSPEQARDARAAVNAAQVAVDLAPTAVDLASSTTRAAQAAARSNQASVGSHAIAAGLLSAQAAADAAQATVTATRAAVEAARAAVDATEVLTASGAAAAGFAAAQTAVNAAKTAVDAAEASQAALGARPQPPATGSVSTARRSPGFLMGGGALCPSPRAPRHTWSAAAELHHGSSPAPSFREAFRLHRLIAAIETAAETGRRVKV